MFEPEEYELVDFGAGRKLERFGTELVDRPSPAAEGIEVVQSGLWETASARYEVAAQGKGRWREPAPGFDAGEGDERWVVGHGGTQLLVKLTTSGNVGLFPEQAGNWDWIAEQVSRCRAQRPTDHPQVRVLNLFAYTGGASLAAAAAGAEVVHVDSSAPTVAWAKRNAAVSGLADCPIRWIVEDAMKFMRREHRRGNSYDGIVADPPTYGHGPKGQPFKFQEHLEELVALCGELLEVAGTRPRDTSPTEEHDDQLDDSVQGRGRFLVFSCHAPGFGPQAGVSALRRVLPEPAGGDITGKQLFLETRDGRQLPAGVSARWSAAVPRG